MDENSLLILEYQENFADNLSIYVYGKILEKNQKRKCFYENNTQKRVKFENTMSNFNLNCGYISTNRVKSIAKDALNYNRITIDDRKIKKEIKSKNKSNNKILNLKHFKIDDIPYISNDILKSIEFSNYNFVKNYDLLEEISNSNSIGLYINENDIIGQKIDWDFISNAIKRLNRYVKRPILYIFCSKDITNCFNSIIPAKFINLSDWKEEFYFLTSCKHKILLNSPNSYSVNFWAIILNNKDYYLNIFDKKLKVKNKPSNWIGI